MPGYVVLWPKAALQVDGKRVVVEKGSELPKGVLDADIANLVVLGAVAALHEPTKDADDVDDVPSPGSIKAVLADVGDDPALAQVALDEELGKGEDARSSLVKKLEAIVAAGDGS